MLGGIWSSDRFNATAFVAGVKPSNQAGAPMQMTFRTRSGRRSATYSANAGTVAPAHQVRRTDAERLNEGRRVRGHHFVGQGSIDVRRSARGRAAQAGTPDNAPRARPLVPPTSPIVAKPPWSMTTGSPSPRTS